MLEAQRQLGAVIVELQLPLYLHFSLYSQASLLPSTLEAQKQLGAVIVELQLLLYLHLSLLGVSFVSRFISRFVSFRNHRAILSPRLS